MEIKDLQANQGKVDIVVEVIEKQEPRTFEKFGKTGKVCSAKVKDASGMVKLTLWNEEIDKITEGDKIHLGNGWCSEYQGEKQVSAGKFGKIEVITPAVKSAKKIDKTDGTKKPDNKTNSDEVSSAIEEEIIE